MRVTVHLSKFYDWVPVPADVDLTPQEIAGPLVMPGRDPGTYRMRVEKPGPTHREMHIKEADIVSKIIDEKVDVRRSGATLTRKQSVAHLVKHLLDDGRYAHAQWSWITSIEVHDDGPDEALARQILAPHTTATHGRTGRVHIPLDQVEAHMKAYLEPADASAHVEHLHAHFGVPAKAVSP